MTLTPVESYSEAYGLAIDAAVKAATAFDCWSVDKVPKKFPRNYVERHLSRRYTENPTRAGGMRDDNGWRLVLRVVCKKTSDGRLMQDRIAARFRAAVDMGGEPTWVRFESSDDAFERADEDYFTADSVWIFVR